MCKRHLFLVASFAACLSLANPVVAQSGKSASGKASKKANNTTPDAEFKKGNAAFDRREWAAARARYTTVLRLQPDHAGAVLNRGRAYFQEGKLDNAIADLRKACELAPEAPAPYTWLAAAALDKGDHAAAIDAADKSLKLDGRQALACYVRGTVLLHKGEFARAIDDLNEADRLNPNDSAVYNNRGIAYQKLGEAEKAAADFRRRDQLKGSKQAVQERVQQAKKQYEEINGQIEVYERQNDLLRRLRPPRSVQVPPELLQRRAAAWNALQEAIREAKKG